MLASLVQVFGEDEAFRYMTALNANVDQLCALRHRPDDRGHAAVKSYVGSTVLHGVINEIVARLSGAAGAAVRRRRLRGRRRSRSSRVRAISTPRRSSYDWALTAEAQKIGLDVKEYAIPTNRNVRAAADGAEAHRRQGHRLRFREIRSRARRASGCSSAGRRKSTRRRSSV